MEHIKPETPNNPDWKEVTYAEEQTEYQPLMALRNSMVPQVPVISAWKLTEEEIAYIVQCDAAGVPAVLYHEQWVFKDTLGRTNLLQPIRMWWGKSNDPTGPWSK